MIMRNQNKIQTRSENFVTINEKHMHKFNSGDILLSE